MGFMTFMTSHFLGVRVWVWAYFLLAILLGFGVALYWHREKLKKFYYMIRFPEKLLKVMVHYPSGLYKIYWRVIPTDFLFKLENKTYIFDDIALIKKNEIFVDTQKPYNKITIGKKKYEFDPKILIKSKGSKYPEIHYFFNCPHPFIFDFKKLKSAKLKITSQNLKTILENNLVQKLLTLKEEKNLLFIILVLSIANAIATAILVLNDLGVFEGKGG